MSEEIKKVEDLNPLGARSTYAILAAAAIGVSTAYGVNLVGVLCEVGVACNQEQLGMAIQAVAPVALGAWAWLERRNPMRKLTFKSRKLR